MIASSGDDQEDIFPKNCTVKSVDEPIFWVDHIVDEQLKVGQAGCKICSHCRDF